LFSSSSLISNYEQQRLHICTVVRRFLLSFELFIPAFCPQVLLSSCSTFLFLFYLLIFLGVKQYLWTYLWHQSLARQTGEAGSDTSRFRSVNIIQSNRGLFSSLVLRAYLTIIAHKVVEHLRTGPCFLLVTSSNISLILSVKTK
jgi:hypothetical protein